MFVAASVTAIATSFARASSSPTSCAKATAARRASPVRLGSSTVSARGVKVDSSTSLPADHCDTRTLANGALNVEFVHEALCSTESEAHPVAARVAVAKRERDVGNPGALVLEHEADAAASAFLQG